ncbi:MAG TPA: HAD-IA family hydrolase [Gemmataceae bacterium]|jgi:putative hydrolase of the HAD superfamily
MARAISLPPVIFFDAVGTLLHPEPSAPAVYAVVGRRFGSRLDEAAIAARFRAAFQRQEEVDRAAGLRTDEEREIARWRSIVREVLDDVSDMEGCFQELYAHFVGAGSWACAPETADVLGTLAARGHMLGIASNFDHRLRGLAEQLPALRPILHLVISSEIGWRKPAPAFFAEMCRQAGSPADRILYVGDDRLNDYEGARAAGLRAMLIAPHSGVIGSETYIKNLSDLL